MIIAKATQKKKFKSNSKNQETNNIPIGGPESTILVMTIDSTDYKTLLAQKSDSQSKNLFFYFFSAF